MMLSHIRRLLPALPVRGALCAAFIAAGALAPAQAQSLDEALAQRVDAQMAQLLGKYPIPGASIAVAYKGEFVYQRGYGVAVVESNTPATPQTLYRIASIAKPVTAVAVLKLFEDELPQALERKVFGADGLLPDAAYPEFANPRDPRVLKITLRDLLQHTAGWGATDYDPQYDLVDIARTMNVKAPASARDVIAFMLKQRSLDVPPGTEFHYSNFGYNILGRIIEHKSGKPYEQAVQELVFKPAGVDDAIVGADKRVQRAASEAAYYDDPRWPAVPDQDGGGATGPESYFGFHLATMDAHGGWVASAADLVRFADAAQGTAKTALLKPQTVALMKRRNGAMPDNNNGLGWVVTRMDGVNILSHSGALTTGSYGYLQAREDGWSWAVLFNRLPIPYPPEKAMADLQAFQTAVQRGLMAAIVNKPDPAPAK
ncbi:serine hydrolase [Herbaspirillum sp. WKF16]|uniref:serine hydrolase domain-containing protein n=1 Tax=Herbaspirillum sp. WKF16 TaxID=3028312 RepID=UPI0023A99F19|nr:serine hydrolase domain-containing protein [Herbaspirillum sp. WKF16]WDZ98196.1 serine hydrolase [Herbaspirillum sp. WKF16]